MHIINARFITPFQLRTQLLENLSLRYLYTMCRYLLQAILRHSKRLDIISKEQCI